mmetsp:Transcript_28494/g.66890  ORF Transcript_28494/g.66890 Transcript_28494/m.66890 type:complete len:210 (-) Transcript_28494:2218-2847(-)
MVVGMVPLSRFLLKYSSRRRVDLGITMLESKALPSRWSSSSFELAKYGKLPKNSLLCSRTTTKFVSWVPTTPGRLPPMLFPPAISVARLVRSATSRGNTPVKSLSLSRKSTRSRRLPSALGSDDDNLFPLKSRFFKLLSCPIELGTFPVNLLRSRYKVWRLWSFVRAPHGIAPPILLSKSKSCPSFHRVPISSGITPSRPLLDKSKNVT